MSKHIRISDGEWEVMSVVWERAPVAAATVAEELAQRKQWSLATVRTLLRRLVEKGAIAKEEDGKRHLYRPRISREESTRHQTESFWDRVLGKAPSSTIVQLVKKAELSSKDIAELRNILREKEK